MPRFIHQGTWTDGNGVVVKEGTVTVYLAGGSTLATIYETETATSAATGSVVESDEHGHFEFWVDATDYGLGQRFKYTLSKTAYTSKDWDDIDIFPTTVDASHFSTFAAAVAAISTSEITVKVTNSQSISANTTLPSTFYTSVEGAGEFNVGAGYTLTFNSPEHITASPKQQIFTGSGTIAFTNPGTVYPQWWGALADGTTDDVTEIQAAIDSIEAAGGGVIYFSSGSYILGTVLTVVNSATKSIHLRGAGEFLTRLRTSSTSVPASGSLITMTCTGNPCTISDMGIVAATGGNRNIHGLELAGNGIQASNLWINGFNRGLYFNDCTNIRISEITSELNYHNFYDNKTQLSVYSNLISYRAVLAGFNFTGTHTVTGTGVLGTTLLSNFSSMEDGFGGDSSKGGIFIESNIPLNISNSSIDNLNQNHPKYGITIAPGALRVSLNNVSVNHAKAVGIYITTTVGDAIVTINGGVIGKTGYMDQTSEWATYGIYKSHSSGTLIVNGTIISNSAGYGLYTKGIWNIINGVVFRNNLAGGSEVGGGVGTTTGNKDLYLDPQATQFHAKVIGCHFDQTTGATTGKTAVFIDDDATPVKGNIKFIGNNVTASGYATTFDSDLSNASLITYDWRDNDGLLTTENSGSGTITGTNLVVTHGLGLTPSAEHITVIGKENPTDAIGSIWVDTIGATTFKVNVEGDPGASNWDFGWKVSIK